MKKSKLLCLALSILGIIFIIVGFLLMYLSDKNEVQQKLNQNQQTIVENYEQLKQIVESFSTHRQKIYDSIFNGTILTEIVEKQTTWHQELEEYETMIDKMTNHLDQTAPLCDITYANQDINSKCQAFLKAYETARNAFIKDTSKYNQLIITYNEQKLPEEQPADIYTSKYKEYVDINQDQIYEGKD